jgi:membrane complex biogenesis BtpA family protein
MISKSVYRPRQSALETLFNRNKVIIGVIHSKPLPGSPEYEGEPMEDLIDYAVEEGRRYAAGGVDALILENHGDIPFLRPNDIGQETAAAMAVMADRVRRETGHTLGINVLGNGALTAIAIAKAAGASFIRVNQWTNAYVANEGFVEGDAAKATRYRSWLRAKDVKVFADVHVKHGAHAIVGDRSIPELTRDAEFFDADVVIATGQRTGNAATSEEIKTIKESTHLPVCVGSGVNIENIGDILSVADGVIIASSLKRDGVWWNEVDLDRVSMFMKEVRNVR